MTLEETLSNLIVDGYIPVHFISQTSWPQFIITVIVTLIVGLGAYFLMYSSGGNNPIVVNQVKKKFTELTGKPTIIINHSKQGFLSQEMIDNKTVTKTINEIDKLQGQDFNLVLETPGGHVYSTMLLSKVMKTYPGKIDVYIPKYSTSGGTILALSGTNIHMTSYSQVGPVDCQLGSMFSQGPASGWEDVVTKKKWHAKDDTHMFARTGKQYQKSIRNYMEKLIKGKTTKTQETLDIFTAGNIEHGYQIGRKELRDLGFNNIKNITFEEKLLLNRMVG